MNGKRTVFAASILLSSAGWLSLLLEPAVLGTGTIIAYRAGCVKRFFGIFLLYIEKKIGAVRDE
ncbi:MAG: hypothetical protein IK090_07170, partial [Clostridia bacterium]|nr:hypothetical protein [Clostridia bacterium]